MGKLNDHFRKDTNSQANNQVEKGQVSVYKLMYYSVRYNLKKHVPLLYVANNECLNWLHVQWM